ncbi:MAG: UDP-N-acetylmuramoyl-tripeptide--D-alanyl-D-alanine ligase [Myxococcota bacterium]
MSAPFRARDAAEWTGGSLLQGRPEARLSGASIDTRSTAPGELFVAIVGPRHDAHAYLSQAIAAGAAGLVVEPNRPLPADLKPDLPVIAVDDTTRALGALGAGHRAAFDGPVVAITGSNGKTTSKEMCAAILSVAAPCLKNQGNLNNQFGLPLTLLRRSEADRSIVVELGMNHRGEIAALAAIARPSVGVVTNVGTAHIEFLGSREEIAREKGDLVAHLSEDGVAALNADDPLVAAQASRTRARVVLFGLTDRADVRAEQVRVEGGSAYAFRLTTRDGGRDVRVKGVGETTVANALAAAAAALAAGVCLADVSEGLARYQPVRGRLQRLELPGDVVLIDDTYNANPESMEIALRSLAKLKGRGRAIAVLGDMGELGEDAERAHRATGRLVQSLGIDFLFALGDRAEWVVSSAIQAGMDPARARVGRDHEETSALLREILRGRDQVLVKGSRAMKMEQIVEHLAGRRER